MKDRFSLVLKHLLRFPLFLSFLLVPFASCVRYFLFLACFSLFLYALFLSSCSRDPILRDLARACFPFTLELSFHVALFSVESRLVGDMPLSPRFCWFYSRHLFSSARSLSSLGFALFSSNFLSRLALLFPRPTSHVKVCGPKGFSPDLLLTSSPSSLLKDSPPLIPSW